MKLLNVGERISVPRLTPPVKHAPAVAIAPPTSEAAAATSFDTGASRALAWQWFLGGVAPVSLRQIDPRCQIDTPEQFVDALFAGTLANCDVNIPIDLWNRGSPELGLIKGRLMVDPDIRAMQTQFSDLASWEAWVEDQAAKKMQEQDLHGTRFTRPVSADMIGADLRGAVFEQDVRRSSFLYADLRGAQLNGPVDQSDFAFSTMDEHVSPFSQEPTSSALTGTPFARDDESLIDGTRLDPDFRADLLDRLARSGQDPFTFLTQTAGVDLSGRLTSSWRSFLHENVVPAVLRDDHRVKPYVFDSVDGRYGQYDGPMSLEGLYNLEVNGGYPLRAAINEGLLRILRSDTPASFRDPFNGAVTPNVLDGWSGNALDFEQWRTQGIQWNTRLATYTVYDCALPRRVVDALLSDPALTDGQRDSIRAMAEDGIVTVGELRPLIPCIDWHVWKILHG